MENMVPKFLPNSRKLFDYWLVHLSCIWCE